MSRASIVMAGFGGQGVMSIGKILAKAAMHAGRCVTWLPSYGPEMRGGTANCTVILDETPIGSPLVKCPQMAIVMNKQSLDKFEPEMAPGGLLVVNRALIDRAVTRADVRSVGVDANAIAEAEGVARSANLVMLGALLAASQVLDAADIEAAIVETFAGKPADVLEKNLRAFHRGAEAARS